MELIKVEDGLLEKNNYFIDTPIDDFLGEYIASKSEGEFKLMKGHIERPFSYEDFVIIVKKRDEKLKRDEELSMYVRSEDKLYGVKEIGELQQEGVIEWRLTKYNDYIQAYLKDKRGVWENVGGSDIRKPIDSQGFRVDGDTEFLMYDYQVYSSPYIYIYNTNEGDSAIAYDKNGKPISERRYTQKGDFIQLYVDDVQEGSIVLYDSDKQVVTQTQKVMLKYGDKYLTLPHKVRLKYKGEILGHECTKLNTRKERVNVVNDSTDTVVNNVSIWVYNETVDEILISLDDKTYAEEVRIPKLDPKEEVELYIKIKLRQGQGRFKLKYFSLEIDEY